MDWSYRAAAIVGVLLLVLLGAWLEARLRGLRERFKARALVKRGQQGEKDAERLLKKLGYTLVTRQPPASYGMLIDGEPRAIPLHADFLIEHNGKRLIAEVKTGKAAKVEAAETRRQLLEYQLAFGVDALLLVDMDTKQVRTVRFPLPKTKPAGAPVPAKRKSTIARWVAVAVMGIATAWLLTRGAPRSDASQAD